MVRVVCGEKLLESFIGRSTREIAFYGRNVVVFFRKALKVYVIFVVKARSN